MAKIQINGAARAIVRANVTPGREFVETATQIGPDVWEVPVDSDTLERLNDWRARLRLDNYSDVILLLAAKRS